jgi:hypothetical protein
MVGVLSEVLLREVANDVERVTSFHDKPIIAEALRSPSQSVPVPSGGFGPCQSTPVFPA